MVESRRVSNLDFYPEIITGNSNVIKPGSYSIEAFIVDKCDERMEIYEIRR